MKWLHNLLKGISLSGALFAFQACYGTAVPPDLDQQGEAPMSFLLVSRSSGDPIEGIRILGGSYRNHELGQTDSDGKCRVVIPFNADAPSICFQDPDGNYAAKDTTLTDLREREILVKMDVAL